MIVSVPVPVPPRTMKRKLPLVEGSLAEDVFSTSTDGTVQIECYRLPLVNMEDSTTESPEIHRQTHRALVHWALFRGYSRPDSEVYDPGRGEKELARFERVFGLKVDAKLRRNTNANRPLYNKAVW